jgi:hypothetical protein
MSSLTGVPMVPLVELQGKVSSATMKVMQKLSSVPGGAVSVVDIVANMSTLCITDIKSNASSLPQIDPFTILAAASKVLSPTSLLAFVNTIVYDTINLYFSTVTTFSIEDTDLHVNIVPSNGKSFFVPLSLFPLERLSIAEKPTSDALPSISMGTIAELARVPSSLSVMHYPLFKSIVASTHLDATTGSMLTV